MSKPLVSEESAAEIAKATMVGLRDHYLELHEKFSAHAEEHFVYARQCQKEADAYLAMAGVFAKNVKEM